MGSALLAILLIWRRPGRSGPGVTLLLAALWLWMGMVYHWLFFEPINPAARLFGWLFIFQGGLFAAVGIGGRLDYRGGRSGAGLIGAGLILYGLAGYPLVGVIAGHEYTSWGKPLHTDIRAEGSTPHWTPVIPDASAPAGKYAERNGPADGVGSQHQQRRHHGHPEPTYLPPAES